VASITWGPEIAEVYGKACAAQSATPVLGPIVGLLAELARGGPALEFAVGTGRVALPLSAPGASRCTASSYPRTWLNGCSPSPAPMRSR
jgi:hypothetical protein